jgi:hypothetical protein
MRSSSVTAGDPVRHRHVAPDRRITAEMKQPHREASHLQSLPSAAEEHNLPCGHDHVDQFIGAITPRLNICCARWDLSFCLKV